MAEFVYGFLEKNEVNTCYQGVVYDRNLTIRANGVLLRIFDMEAISDDVPAGQNYDMLVDVFPKHRFQSVAAVPIEKTEHEWQGTVINRHWTVSENRFRWFYPSTVKPISKHDFSLIATSVGNVVVDSSYLDHLPDDILDIKWHNFRLDLLAIV